MEFRHVVNGIGSVSSRYFYIEMFVASSLFMAAVHDFENVVTDVSDVSCNIVQLRYAVFFLGRGGGNRYRGHTLARKLENMMDTILPPHLP